MNLKQTPLLNEHKKLGAKLAPFGGWLMPISYGSIIDEHNWSRTHASCFDICHMGEFIISGEGANQALNKIVTMNLDGIASGNCRYGFMLNEEGGIVDDLIVYKIDEDRWMLVVNAATTEKDKAQLKKHLPDKLNLDNISENTGKLDLQGPYSKDILKKLVGDGVEKLNYYTFSYFKILDEENIISRTGYTGELGYEIYISKDKIKDLWNRLMQDKRVKPAGLGARDTLRLEMAYPLYGQDITEDTIPQEAGLDQFVDFSKDFIGKGALIEKKEKDIKRKLVCFKTTSRRSPRHNYKIYHDNKEIGVVASGSFSPSLGVGIGMGYIDEDFSGIGTKITVKGNSAIIEAKITEKPFYKKGSARD